MNKRNTLKLLVMLLSGATLKVSANGFLLPDQDAFATARGEAFAATADNASAVYYNPAGITQMEGNNFRGGLYGIYLDPTFQPPNTQPNAGTTYTIGKHYDFIPQAFFTHSFKSTPFSVGLGVYSPYGLSTSWPQNTGFRTLGMKGSLTTLAINPVVAFKVFPGLSIGGGVVIDYANLDWEQGLTSVPNNDFFRFKGDGWNVGYNLGVLWQPWEKISVGATFRSAITMNLNGHTESEMNGVQPTLDSPATADLPLPLNTVVGISYRPTPKWNLEFDADYVDWGALGTLIIHQSTPPPILPYSNVPLTLNWQSSWLYEFGVTRFFDNGWHVSAGYVYNENSVPDAHYTPVVADLARHFFSVGTGYRGKRFNFDIAYQFCYGPDRTVTGSAPSAAGQTADGTYGFISDAVLLTVGMHF